MDAERIVEGLEAALPGIEAEVVTSVDQPAIHVGAGRLPEVMTALRDLPHFAFVLLSDLTAVDWWPGEPRFEVVYHLASIEHRARLRVKVRVPGEKASVPTVRTIWPVADWLEREVWDFFGIVFDGHPDLRRLLMPEDWEGHPLRKDYPVQIKEKVKVYTPLQLSEEEFKANLQADRETRGGADEK